MRKKTIKTCADTILWYAVYLLPIIAYIVYSFSVVRDSVTAITFAEFMTSIDITIIDNNIIYTALADIFGSGGIMPLLTPSMIAYFAYFASCLVVHLAVDVLLFIPRLAHNWIASFEKGVQND